MNKKIYLFISSIILAFTSLLFTGCSCSDEKDHYYRAVTQNDIIIEQNINDIFSMSFIVRPQETIENLFIKFSFFDNKDNPIIAKTKELGNINNGEEYNIQISFSNDNDYTLNELLKISKYKTSYFNGKIKVNQNIKGPCLNHSFNDGVITKNVTCSETGEKTYTCNNCNYKKTEQISYLKHDYTLWKIIEEATTTKPGKCWNICKKCAVREQFTINPKTN